MLPPLAVSHGSQQVEALQPPGAGLPLWTLALRPVAWGSSTCWEGCQPQTADSRRRHKRRGPCVGCCISLATRSGSDCHAPNWESLYGSEVLRVQEDTTGRVPLTSKFKSGLVSHREQREDGSTPKKLSDPAHHVWLTSAWPSLAAGRYSTACWIMRQVFPRPCASCKSTCFTAHVRGWLRCSRPGQQVGKTIATDLEFSHRQVGTAVVSPDVAHVTHDKGYSRHRWMAPGCKREQSWLQAAGHS